MTEKKQWNGNRKRKDKNEKTSIEYQVRHDMASSDIEATRVVAANDRMQNKVKCGSME